MNEYKLFSILNNEFLKLGKRGFKIYYYATYSRKRAYVLYKHIKKISDYCTYNDGYYIFEICCNTLEAPNIDQTLLMAFEKKEVA